jgi:hypothetical protein
MAAATVLSAAVQWYNSREAQNASQEELDRVRSLIERAKEPNFDMRSIMPEEVRVLQKYIPETIPYINEVAPQTVKAASAGAVEGRQAQLESLSYMRKLMDQGYDPQTAVEMAQAQRAASAESASARATAQAEAARRGFGGGPSFYQAGADQAGMDRLALAQQNALSQAAQRRMGAAGQAATLGGQIRGEDVSLEAMNVAAINAFNQRQAAAQRDWMQQQANVRNQAQQFNIGEGQRVYEKNLQGAYDAAVRNQGQQNTLAQQQYQNTLARATGAMPVSQMQMGMNYQGAEQSNRAIQAMTDLASKMAMEKYGYDRDEELQAKGYAPRGYVKG